MMAIRLHPDKANSLRDARMTEADRKWMDDLSKNLNAALDELSPELPCADVLTTELRAWFVQNPKDRPYPPVIGVTRFNRALVAGPLGDVLVPHAREVVYPLVSEPRMPLNAIIQRLRHFHRAERHAKLFSVVHSYGFMTFHFMYEIVPKIAEGIALLRANPENRAVRPPNRADELFVPSTGHSGYTNPELVRALLAHLPARVENNRPYVLYASRGSSSDRRVRNEHELIEALRHAAPYPLVIFTNRETPTQIVALFRGAAAVVGFHRAGLVNAMFCAPGTPLIEMMFTFEPHWDFMQLARALGMRYWLVPVPQSWWMQPLVTAPVGQVVATLIAALGKRPPPARRASLRRATRDSGLGQDYSGEIDDPGESKFAAQRQECLLCSGCGSGRMGDGASCWPYAPGWFAPESEASPTCPHLPSVHLRVCDAARASRARLERETVLCISLLCNRLIIAFDVSFLSIFAPDELNASATSFSR
eukprot:gene26701-biopygen3995